MRSSLGAVRFLPRLSRCGTINRARALIGALAIAAVLPPPAQAVEPPAAALLERLCDGALRPNEQDRLYGMISLTVRTTIEYEGGSVSPDLIDDAVQNGLTAMLDACPHIAQTAANDRLGMVVALIRDATLLRMHDPDAHYSTAQTDKATAADLSEELSAEEIDAWLDALPARQRALALFLYAARPSRDEIAAAVGSPPAALAAASQSVKTDLLQFYRAGSSAAPPPPIPGRPAIAYREAGFDLAAPPAAEGTGAAKPDAGPAVRITGISSDIYAGWSLLASVTGLAPDRAFVLDSPVILDPDTPGRRRMLAVAVDEIGDRHDKVRRFLVKAYAIDGDKEGSGLPDSFHVGARLANAAARQTLRNKRLSSIEIARCLWHDFGTHPDPGLCR